MDHRYLEDLIADLSVVLNMTQDTKRSAHKNLYDWDDPVILSKKVAYLEDKLSDVCADIDAIRDKLWAMHKEAETELDLVTYGYLKKKVWGERV